MYRLAVLLVACGPDKVADTSVPPAADLVLIADGLPATLVTVWGSSATDVWVGGAQDASGPLVYHYDGATWTRLDTTGLTWDVWWLWGDGAGTLFMAGSKGNVARVDIASSTITVDAVGDPAYTMFGTWGTSASDAWAVGGDILGDQPGGIFHWDGSAWSLSAEASPRTDGTQRDAFKVWGRSASDVFVVGTSALTMHWDGSAWTDIVSPLDPSITLFTMSGDADGTLAVGGQGNGLAQTVTADSATAASPDIEQLAAGFLGVYDREGMDPIVSTTNGVFWWYRSDGVWEKDTRTPITSRGLHAVWVDPDGGVWSVGGDLAVLTYGVIVYAGNDTVPLIE